MRWGASFAWVDADVNNYTENFVLVLSCSSLQHSITVKNNHKCWWQIISFCKILRTIERNVSENLLFCLYPSCDISGLLGWTLKNWWVAILFCYSVSTVYWTGEYLQCSRILLIEIGFEISWKLSASVI